MLFNSYIFILCFLPIFVAGYFGLNYFFKKNLGQLFLLAMSIWFYGYFNISYLLLITLSILFNYGVYLLFSYLRKDGYRKIILVNALMVNIGILLYFKYYNFFIAGINAIFKQNFLLRDILLPLGISFFTFQQLSFVIDAYRKEVGKCTLLEYASFVTFFPQLIAGPIVTHDELIPQFKDQNKKMINWDNLTRGMFLFVLGLAKKVLIADTFGNAVNWGFDNIVTLNTTSALVVMFSYTIQIYFDFSGYCDMAVGIGKMINIDLPLNFNSPYKAVTIEDFWERWHITLTRFLTKYVYIPLGGSRKGKGRTYINTLIVFVISGFWHGANVTFILWGACHGVFMVITKSFRKVISKIPRVVNWLITFLFINITWVVFRADTLNDAIQFVKQILQFNFGEIGAEIIECFNLPEFLTVMGVFRVYGVLEKFPYFLFLIFSLVAIFLAVVARNAYEKMQRLKPTLISALVTAVLLVWCIFSLAGVSTFLYFNF